MSELQFGKELTAKTTPIPGMVVFDLPVHGDTRGWFKENWQREKMIALGLPDFGPVQNNISFNAETGVTRGIHAEPWDKLISIASGKIFGAWVDLREGESFGQVFTLEMDPSKAIFVPRGVANAYQALEANTVYTYLVNDHWRANAEYTSLHLADTKSAIPWPIPLEQAVLSEKDKSNPQLDSITPIKPRKILVTGANGQLGRAIRIAFPDAEFVTHQDFDISNPNSYNTKNWHDYSAIINAAAYTAVDDAETPEGRKSAWRINAKGVSLLARTATEYRLTLFHVSSEYVFNGANPEEHGEDEPLSPLGVYAQTKAAGDIAASGATRHYIIRTSWVVGDGLNFVRTMKSLAEKGVKPSVVDDQIGRLSFTSDLAQAIKHLIATKPSYGIYNVTNDGLPTSWTDVAKAVYERTGHNPDDVSTTSTEEYFSDKPNASPRPKNSLLSLDKIKQTGFTPRDWSEALNEYLEQEKNQ